MIPFRAGKQHTDQEREEKVDGSLDHEARAGHRIDVGIAGAVRRPRRGGKGRNDGVDEWQLRYGRSGKYQVGAQQIRALRHANGAALR